MSIAVECRCLPATPTIAIRALAALELPVALALAPLLIFPTPGRALALAVIPIIWAAAWITTGRPIPATPINGALGLLLSWACARSPNSFRR
jgi:hypothetical protein